MQLTVAFSRGQSHRLGESDRLGDSYAPIIMARWGPLRGVPGSESRVDVYKKHTHFVPAHRTPLFVAWEGLRRARGSE